MARRPGGDITRNLAPRAGALLRREGAGLAAAAVALVVVLAYRVPFEGEWPTGREAFCYWLPSLSDPYLRSDWTQQVAYVYSPAFLQGIAWLKVLPWTAFLGAWTAILLLAVRFLVGPRLWAVAILLAAIEILGGNIHLLLAVAIVVGFRWPAAWSFVLLTKVTPGVGLLWFVVRREWRNLAIALGATAVVVVVSWAIAPRAWADWVDVLAASSSKTAGTWSAVPVPIWLRLPLAAALVAWGARTDRRWTVPVGAMLALPALWFGGTSMLLAAVAIAAGRVPRSEPPTAPSAREPGRAWRPGRTSLRPA
jgi:Glycosyltransferase family 87